MCAGAFAGVCPGAQALKGKKVATLSNARVASMAHVHGQLRDSYAECMAKGVPWSKEPVDHMV